MEKNQANLVAKNCKKQEDFPVCCTYLVYKTKLLTVTKVK